MDHRSPSPRWRIGTTSYIIPADLIANVAFLGRTVGDIQLVLFESDSHGSNLPDAATRARLRELAAAHRLTYTVHLPMDLALSDGGKEHISMTKARRVIDATHELHPFAYTMHLDGQDLLQPGVDLPAWQARARCTLETVCRWVDDPGLLCVENVERWDPAAFDPVVEQLPVSRTIDIGHLWLMGEDPLLRLPGWIGRARVVHLHGVAGRDHRSLAEVPPDRLDPVVDYLARRFTGVLTLEVFDKSDLDGSLAAIAASLARSEGR